MELLENMNIYIMIIIVVKLNLGSSFISDIIIGIIIRWEMYLRVVVLRRLRIIGFYYYKREFILNIYVV